jgi:hypothetical protein
MRLLVLAVALVAATAVPARAQVGAPVPGNDISFPQCGKTFPSGQSFGIVGVNAGVASSGNPCLGPYLGGAASTSELDWAVTTSSGVSSQPKASLYVNTGDPGNVYAGRPVATWPKSGATPYGSCTTMRVRTRYGTYTVGRDSPACAYEYGRERAATDVKVYFADAAAALAGAVSSDPSAYQWWLDVETANTWQSGSSGRHMNVADLRGMVDYLASVHPPAVGVYSTATDWQAITGGTGPSSALYGLPVWLPGASDPAGAGAMCSAASFSGGPVRLTQWTAAYDDDLACPE